MKTELSIVSIALALLGCDGASPPHLTAPACIDFVEARIGFDARCTFTPFRHYRAEDRACLLDECTQYAAAQGGTDAAAFSARCMSALKNDVCTDRGPPACLNGAQPERLGAPRRLGEYCGDDSPDCVWGLQCDGARCVTPQGLGGECVSDSGCQLDLACEKRICEPRRVLGEPCHQAWLPLRSDCELDAVCDAQTERCVIYRSESDPDALLVNAQRRSR